MIATGGRLRGATVGLNARVGRPSLCRRQPRPHAHAGRPGRRAHAACRLVVVADLFMMPVAPVTWPTSRKAAATSATTCGPWAGRSGSQPSTARWWR